MAASPTAHRQMRMIDGVRTTPAPEGYNPLLHGSVSPTMPTRLDGADYTRSSWREIPASHWN